MTKRSASHASRSAVILGIDPGTRRVGYGLVRKDGGKLEFLDAGILKIKSRNNFDDLREINMQMLKLIKRWRPDVLAIEKLYFVKNLKTGMPVAEARGVIILTAIQAGLKVKEFSPNEVKSGLTGYGHADKAAVLKMVRLILGKPELKLIDDASDALGIAIFAGQALRPPPSEARRRFSEQKTAPASRPNRHTLLAMDSV